MSAFNLTYDSLADQLSTYAERTDTPFIDAIPSLIAYGENRIAAEARGLGFMQSITDVLVVNQTYLAKPARWRETVSFQIGTDSTTSYNTRVMLLERSYEYCRVYWPDDSQTGTPRFYADWTYQNWLVAPTPDYAYPYEIIYHERPQPLDDDNQTNWTTQYAPQLLLYGCLLESQHFLKRTDRVPEFQAEYDRALKQVEYEQKRRMMDRSNSLTNA